MVVLLLLAGRAIAASWGKRDRDHWARDQTPRVSAPRSGAELHKSRRVRKRAALIRRRDRSQSPHEKPSARPPVRGLKRGMRRKGLKPSPRSDSQHVRREADPVDVALWAQVAPATVSVGAPGEGTLSLSQSSSSRHVDSSISERRSRRRPPIIHKLKRSGSTATLGPKYQNRPRINAFLPPISVAASSGPCDVFSTCSKFPSNAGR